MKTKNNIIIAILLLFLTIAGISYAAFSSKLNITGTSNISSNFSVRITDVKTGNIIGNASDKEQPTFTDTSANFSALLQSPGDSISYEVTVSNQGTLDAVISSIKINAPKQEFLDFSVEGININDDLLKNASKTFYVVVKYNENNTNVVSNVKTDFSVQLEYVQKGNKSYSTYDITNNEVENVTSFRISTLNLAVSETSIEANVIAKGATKYYYSLDNSNWYESAENTYKLENLKPNTDYTVYTKAENDKGEVVFGSKSTKTDDVTKPNIDFVLSNNVEGNSGFYKGLSIEVQLNDNDQIKNTLYCTTSEDKCNPNDELTVNNNKATVQFESSKENQTLCVQTLDRKGNGDFKCTDSYKIDGKSPKLNDIILTPNNNTLTMQIEAKDEESGIVKYYYSKDGGNNYVESSKPNYTFTNLEEGDYLITAYIEDAAGNVSKTFVKTATIRNGNWCESKDINDLGDCVIAAEAGKKSNINNSKKVIEEKRTPNFNLESPKAKYKQIISNNTSIISSGYSKYYIGTDYTFNENTGTYNILNAKLQNPTTINYKSGNYYVCGDNANAYENCKVMYRITDVMQNNSSNKTSYTFTKYNYTQTPISYSTNDSGLYVSSDDDGTSYYYRGSVSGNYVKFAGFYWRIVRINGDGTIRLIYDGTKAHANGESSKNRQVGTEKFNLYNNDNSYVGYMYGNANDFKETDSGDLTFDYTGLSNTAKYYFATDYVLDEKTRSYKLSGDLHSAVISASETGYYTCFSTSKSETCQNLYYTINYNNGDSMAVKVKGYGQESLDNNNTADSTIKEYLDAWYENNLLSLDNVVSKNAAFCNNRLASLNTGYGIIPTNYAAARINGLTNTPSLSCADKNDTFSVTKTSGNGDLDSPVGLITADEINMAGGITNLENQLYYLYSGNNYWTMSPAQFTSTFKANEMAVDSKGMLKSSDVLDEYGVRPVINIDPQKITFTGNGTMENPYIIEEN